ncbi:MAG: phosphoribosylamine--glycine ligase [Ignavibacteria bacterium]|nr:phosphoribosylamine--glycine ligase [Ignavibacteria bacterium]
MKILLVGNGGREHTLGWGIVNSQSFRETNSRLFCTIGSAGLDSIATPINIRPDDINGIVRFSIENNIDFVVIGPELPLSLGLVDELNRCGIMAFGPTKKAAEIESSKIFAKNLMKDANIPTADFRTFSESEYQDAIDYLKISEYPIVIKADGLAAGKGVVIADNFADAQKSIEDLVVNKVFGNAGKNFVIEQFLSGYEMSVFAITDGSDYLLLPPSQDHKRIGEGDTGKNTGGMGAYSPLPEKFYNVELENKIKEKIIEPALNQLKKINREYKGCLYCGLMISEFYGVKEPFVVEFNCRFGDPESQAVIPLIKSDFLQLLIASANDDIKNYKLETYNKYSACVIIASGGYPDKYQTGKIIYGLDKVSNDCFVFHSGTKIDECGNVITSGGRVLGITALSDVSLKDAFTKTYENIKLINFENCYYRRDIGYKVLN